ncbi:MAG: hypothetical protein HZC41_26440 [Chloroflexi bacterium]|nr:hypothetical protein [Chloroflexota bacterium]
MPEQRILCCEDSIQVGEALAGTAPRSEVWLLLEYAAPWGAKALDESALPDAVKDRLNGWLKAIPSSRLQLVKQDKAGDTRAFYIALARQGRLYRFDLAGYETLLVLDIPALVGGTADYEAHRSGEKLFLACTNGKRDVCCARYGLPLYQQLRAAARDSTWQSSHIGGHRFAPTMVCLPHGLYYGRVDDPAPVVDAYRRGEFYTTNCRGRCVLPPAAQAAEIYLRDQLGLRALDALQLLEVEQHDDRWTARLAAGDVVYAVMGRALPLLVLESTGEAERGRVTQHVAERYEIVTE